MIRQRCLSITAALILFSSLAAGQGMSVTVSPNPAQPGQTIQVAVTDALGTGMLHCCAIKEVRAGTPTGPSIYTVLCNVGTLVAPHGTITDTWNQLDSNGNQVPDGVYWIRFSYLPAMTTTVIDEWVSVNITSAASAPVLRLAPSSSPQIGTFVGFEVDAPHSANGAYFTAASWTTNVGQSLGSEFIHLDNDFLFQLSISPSSETIFSNFVGTCDETGLATGLGFTLPNLPQLQGLPLHVQALVQDTHFGGFDLTNAVHMTIL